MSTDKNGQEVEVRGNLGLRRSNLELQSKNGEATGKKVEVYNCEDRIANVHRQEWTRSGNEKGLRIAKVESRIAWRGNG